MNAPPDRRPRAHADTVKNALRLVALDEVAARRGLVVGQTLTDARAITPDLVVEMADAAADAALLVNIAEWCDRYTPLVALDVPDGLFLDITGCAHLFGGEAAFLDDLGVRLRAQGFAACCGLADTPGAAWAVARFAARPTAPALISQDGHRAALEPLSLHALRLPGEVVATLARLGLKTVGQILGQPRAALASRFGPEALRRLDQALGRADEAISPRLPVPAFFAERRFAEPVGLIDDIRATLRSLAQSLCQTLAPHEEGARLLELTLFGVDGAVSRMTVGTSRPVRKPRLIGDLFEQKLKPLDDHRDIGFGFDLIRLAAIETQRADPAQISLDGRAVGEEALHQLIDRLGARLGIDQVARIAPHDSHIPEQASCEVPAALADEAALDWSGETPAPADLAVDRPLRLFNPPEPVEAMAEVPEGPPIRFRWRRALYEVARADGPERIAGQWWRGPTPTRDYFRIEDGHGRRFWIYREGLYGRETDRPRWFLHGLFA